MNSPLDNYYRERCTIFSTPDQCSHSQTVPVLAKDGEYRSEALQVPPREIYENMPSYLWPIHNNYINYGKKKSFKSERLPSKDKVSDHNVSIVDPPNNEVITCESKCQDAVQRILNGNINGAALPDLHATYPSAQIYLHDVKTLLGDRIFQIKVSGVNPREKVSKFGGRIILHEPEKDFLAKKKLRAPVTERDECELLIKHTVCLSNKWRRETAIFDESMAMALELFEVEIGEGHDLEQALFHKEATLNALIKQIEFLKTDFVKQS